MLQDTGVVIEIALQHRRTESGYGRETTAAVSLPCRASLGHWSLEKGGTEVTWGQEKMLCTMRVRGLYLFSSQKGDGEVTLLSLQHLPGEKSLGTLQEGRSKDLWLTTERHQPELSCTFIMAEWSVTETTNKENGWFFFSWTLFTWQTQGIGLTVRAGRNERVRRCQVIQWYSLGLGTGDVNRTSSPSYAWNNSVYAFNLMCSKS